VLRAAGPARLRIATKTVPLAQVEREWSARESNERVVFIA
jgi:hypothetical protein